MTIIERIRYHGRKISLVSCKLRGIPAMPSTSPCVLGGRPSQLAARLNFMLAHSVLGRQGATPLPSLGIAVHSFHAMPLCSGSGHPIRVTQGPSNCQQSTGCLVKVSRLDGSLDPPSSAMRKPHVLADRPRGTHEIVPPSLCRLGGWPSELAGRRYFRLAYSESGRQGDTPLPSVRLTVRRFHAMPLCSGSECPLRSRRPAEGRTGRATDSGGLRFWTTLPR